jgi:hypothetical protein
MTPNNGARCADAIGTSCALDPAARSAVAKSFRTCKVSADTESDAGMAELNARSQIERSARPWATEARRPTVQMMEASRASSRAGRFCGRRCAARRKGRVVEAWEERERCRKVEKEGGRLCAR